jgi:hypothetical protein
MILCPHCARPVEDERHECGHAGFSRRSFFGLFTGAIAALALPAKAIEPLVKPVVFDIVVSDGKVRPFYDFLVSMQYRSKQ